MFMLLFQFIGFNWTFKGASMFIIFTAIRSTVEAIMRILCSFDHNCIRVPS